MDKKEQAKAFAALPKAERKTAFAALPEDVKPLAREIVTAKYRGFRHVNGRVEFSQEALAEQIAHFTAKEAELEDRKAKVGARLAELNAEYAERFGAVEDNAAQAE